MGLTCKIGWTCHSHSCKLDNPCVPVSDDGLILAALDSASTERFDFCRLSHEKYKHSIVINKRQNSMSLCLLSGWIDFYMKDKQNYHLF